MIPIFFWQEISAPVMEGNDAVTGHIISTTIGGKNGEEKRVSAKSCNYVCILFHILESMDLKLSHHETSPGFNVCFELSLMFVS